VCASQWQHVTMCCNGRPRGPAHFPSSRIGAGSREQTTSAQRSEMHQGAYDDDDDDDDDDGADDDDDDDGADDDEDGDDDAAADDDNVDAVLNAEYLRERDETSKQDEHTSLQSDTD